MKVFVFPTDTRTKRQNPYISNYKSHLKKWLDVDCYEKKCIMKSTALFRYSFCSDVFILNWIENVQKGKFGLFQYFISVLALYVIKFRKKKIVWMLHNITPHENESYFSTYIRRFLLKHAALIISHSIEGRDSVKLIAKGQVEYICHPVSMPDINVFNGCVDSCDVLIWGRILPYKGVAEFLEEMKNKIPNKKIVILGKCTDEKLENRITQSITSNIIFENRAADFGEIAAYVKKAQYVLFPYVGDSISSSGVLMETIAMSGGVPVGPNKGAFRDLANDGLCLTYDSYDELLSILGRVPPTIDFEKFIRENSWDAFVKKVCRFIQNEDLGK